MGVTIIGIDLAKNVFRLHGCDEEGRAVLRKQLTRGQLLAFIAQVPACTVAMEACASAHYWAREVEQLGHRVRLVNRRFVKPYVKANKNDASDAEAICEAASRPSMRFVPVKTAAQLEVRALHRVRQQLVKGRTALINQVRGLLAEHGIVLPQGRAQLQRGLARILEDADPTAERSHARDPQREQRAAPIHRGAPAPVRTTYRTAVLPGPTLPTVGAGRRGGSANRYRTGGSSRQCG
jgi:transposase